MIERLIASNQTGADLGALKAAVAASVPCGGFAPRNFLVETDDGRDHVPRPELATLYGLTECPEPTSTPPDPASPAWKAWAAACYVARRKANVALAASAGGVALLFGDNTSPGSRGLIADCRRAEVPLLWVVAGETTAGDVLAFLGTHRASTILAAGNRASKDRGIEQRVEGFLGRVFKLAKTTEGTR